MERRWWRIWGLTWPWMVVLGFTIWLTWWLWNKGAFLLTGETLWYPMGRMAMLHRIAASIRGALSAAPELAYPLPELQPGATAQDYSVLEWWVVSPPAVLTAFPMSWGLTQTLWILMMALAMATLARVLGCRGPGLVVAGALGALNWPYWHDMLMGRGNATWISVALLAVAAIVALARRVATATLRPEAVSRRGTLALGATACALGAAVLVVYPPLAMLLAPLGMIALARPLRRAPMAVARAVGAVALLGLLLAGPTLMSTLQRYRAVSGPHPTSALRCPSRGFVAEGRDLLRLTPAAFHEKPSPLQRPAAPVGAWILAPLALLTRRRRLKTRLLVAMAAAAMLLSLGPCPQWSYDPLAATLPRGMLRNLWEPLSVLKDFGRSLTAGLILTALLSGQVVTDLWRRGRWARGGAMAATLLVVGQPAWHLQHEIHNPSNWHEAVLPETARFLRAAEPGLTAELPFELRYHPLSESYTPHIPRFVPVFGLEADGQDQPGLRYENRFYSWLHELSLARPTTPLPSRADVERSGMRWIFHSPARCQSMEPPPGPECQVGIPAALDALLGPGQPLGGGVTVWDVRAALAAGLPGDPAPQGGDIAPAAASDPAALPER